MFTRETSIDSTLFIKKNTDFKIDYLDRALLNKKSRSSGSEQKGQRPGFQINNNAGTRMLSLKTIGMESRSV